MIPSATIPGSRTLSPGSVCRSASTERRGGVLHHHGLAGMIDGKTASFAGIVITNAYTDRLQPILLSAGVSGLSPVFSECFDFHLKVMLMFRSAPQGTVTTTETYYIDCQKNPGACR